MRKVLLFALCALMVFAMAVTVYAGKNGQSGKSNTGHLYLREKDPSDWSIVEDGAWGKMKYNLEGPEFCFVFNGHGLEPGVDYCLIYYPDPWPGEGLICLGTGTGTDPDGLAIPPYPGGDVHIKGCVNTDGDLPKPYDAAPLGGAKIWLVLCDDVDCVGDPNATPPVMPQMTGWTPSEYLFEDDVINFEDTDAPPPAPGKSSTTAATWGSLKK